MGANTSGEPGASSLDELIVQRGAAHPDGVFLEDARSERVVRFGELAALTARAAALEAPGAVLIAAPDPLDFVVLYLGALAAGNRAVPVAPDSSEAALETLRAQFDGATVVLRSLDELPTATAGSGSRGGSAVLFTSGSTGTPKGVELTEAQLMYVAEGVARHNRLGADDRGFNPLPLFHINAEVVALLASLVAGSTLVLDRRFRRTGFWELMRERRVSWINAVPAILAILAKEPLDPPANLRFIRSASAPLPDSVARAFAGIPLVLSYGMTEAASQITATPLDGTAVRGTVGRPVGTEVEVRDDEGNPVAPASVGQLWIRGPGVISRYFGGVAADRFDAAGWLRTGDVGRIDDGFVTLLGRSDDVINRGGELVYPADVEDALLGDPRVREAVVVGKPDTVLGEVPVAFVIAADDTTDAGDLRAALRERVTAELPRQLRPAEIEIVTDLPRAATGKVQRARIRASFDEKADVTESAE